MIKKKNENDQRKVSSVKFAGAGGKTDLLAKIFHTVVLVELYTFCWPWLTKEQQVGT